MSLSKRDTFVRYLDPPHNTVWEDANGDAHLSLPDALKSLGMENTQENRDMFLELLKKSGAHPGAKVRQQPDSVEYYTQRQTPEDQ